MSDFIWSIKKNYEIIATISNGNITLNKPGRDFFASAASVLLGIDYKNKKIAIKPLTSEQIETGHIPENQRHNITVKASYARICNVLFMKEVADLLNKNLANPIKRSGYYSKSDDALIIDLI